MGTILFLRRRLRYGGEASRESFERALTIATVPPAGHSEQADEREFVTKTMRAWWLR